MRKIVDGNEACANIAYLFSEICSIYPITPSSPMASKIDSLTRDKKNLFNEPVKVIEMQSEAGAAGAMHGALITGSLASTFTASQGLLLMIPNMYKMAGEMLPGVIHVAARSLATQALSIFGDHQDVYATRQTGFCMLASTNVFDAQNLAAIAHLSAIESSLPFLHFFDGFRTSHELNTIDILEEKDLLPLINYDKINEFKNKMLIGNKIQKGMTENEDIYFQSMEAKNMDYLKVPDIVNDYMKKINKIMKTNYKPFNYYGDKDATNVIIAMGSVCDTIKLVVDDLVKKEHKIGLVEVHLYRPFSSKYLLNVLPSTTKNIAVLDRTKEQGSIGEPLYLDVLAALKNTKIKIVGGRYGLSSKNTTLEDIYDVYSMLNSSLKDSFVIGIDDDVTNLSLKKNNYHLETNFDEVLIYGFGSDGMVSTSKNIMKTIGANTNAYVQGYFQYDSKKSGGVTISHLRIGKNKINAPYYVTNAKLVVVTKDEYLFKYDVLKNVRKNGTLILNTSIEPEKLNAFLPNNIKKSIVEKNIKLFLIDADNIALECGIKGKISKIMEVIILYKMNFKDTLNYVQESIKKQFKNKGKEIIDANLKASLKALNALKKFEGKLEYEEETNIVTQSIFEVINLRKGDDLKVSDLLNYRDGTFPGGLSKLEKRRVSTKVATWIKENCIQCGQCSLVCPHAVIRPFITNSEDGIPLLGDNSQKYEIAISGADCTSCGLCVNVCPGKASKKALTLDDYNPELQKKADELFNNHYNESSINKFTIKGSQYQSPCFEFSGACAGCGETPYIKLLTQLFKEKLLIANATGCSSIYGGSVPSTPYTIPWANSLFEDNAEFGFGMYLSYLNTRQRIKHIMENDMNKASKELKSVYAEWLNNSNDYEITSKIKEKIENYNIPKELLDLKKYISAKSVWIIGGDGWAYDIGFGGIDHVLSSNENINILVLDTEVYSNTGGQSSKSSRYGQVSEFADFGKRTYKKDLFKIAMTYPNCYVGNVSFGANFMQTIKTFKEAEEHNGPSIIIAYSPCVEHGIKGGMSNSIDEQIKAVQCGYVSLMRYNPEEKKLYIDSKEPDFDKYEDFLKNEVRYNSLYIKDKDLALELLEENKNNAKNRYLEYVEISKRNGEKNE